MSRSIVAGGELQGACEVDLDFWKLMDAYSMSAPYREWTPFEALSVDSYRPLHVSGKFAIKPGGIFCMAMQDTLRFSFSDGPDVEPQDWGSFSFGESCEPSVEPSSNRVHRCGLRCLAPCPLRSLRAGFGLSLRALL